MSKRRALLCVMLAVSLSAPRLLPRLSAAAEESHQILTLGPQAPTILVNHGPRIGHDNQRTTADSPFVVPLNTPAADCRRSAEAAEDSRLQSRCAARTDSGRSPPVSIS